MSCEKYKSRLLDFALGAEEADVRAHLEACHSCRAELDAQRALLEKIDCGVAAMVAAEPSGDFAAHVRGRIAEHSSANRPWFVGWMPITAAALSLVVLIVFLTIRKPAAPDRAYKAPSVTVAPASGKEDVPPESAVGPRTPRGGQSASAQNPSARIGRTPRPSQSAANREPEVLVPRGEMAAVIRLYNANWAGKVDAESMFAAAVPTSEFLKPWTTPELKIAPLEILPPVEDGKPKSSLENR